MSSNMPFTADGLYRRMGGSLTDDAIPPVTTHLRIVLLGKTGSGKSATGNTILKGKAFRACLSPSSVTEECQKETDYFDTRTVSVIDTPGIFDTSKTNAEVKSVIEHCVSLSAPGPHVFLLVIRLDLRFTIEERNTVEWIKDNFGEDASKHTLVLFTGGDLLEEPIEQYIHKSPELRRVLCDFKAGYVVFDNTQEKNVTQVADLFEKIDEIVHRNGGCYTIKMYDEAQRQIRNREWWRKCKDRAHSCLMVVGTAAAVVHTGAVLMVGEAAAESIGPSLLVTGVTSVLGKWMPWK